MVDSKPPSEPLCTKPILERCRIELLMRLIFIPISIYIQDKAKGYPPK